MAPSTMRARLVELPQANQIASITALILLVPSVGFMLFIERFLKADVLAKVGS
jgi:hypothetical protein